MRASVFTQAFDLKLRPLCKGHGSQLEHTRLPSAVIVSCASEASGTPSKKARLILAIQRDQRTAEVQQQFRIARSDVQRPTKDLFSVYRLSRDRYVRPSWSSTLTFSGCSRAAALKSPSASGVRPRRCSSHPRE